MKKLLFTLLIIIAFSGLGFAQVIDTELQNAMNQRSNEMISVNIILKSEMKLENASKSVEGITDKKIRRDALIDELKLFAEKEQAEILSILKAEERNSKVSDIRSSWAANSITCTTTNDVIYLLAEHPDVLMIGYNEEKMLLWDEKSSKASPEDKMTENITKVNADDVWELGVTGEGVLVAIIDSGVNYNHVDLADHMWDGGAQFPHHGYDTYEDDNDPMDEFGHGTHCAGTICGDGTSGTKTGMAPNATLMCIKCVSNEGMGGAADINNGMEWAIEHHADVLSMSLGIPLSSIADRTMLRRTSVTALELGVVAAVAVGNEGNNELFYPTPDNVRVPGSCPPPWIHPDQESNSGELSCVVAIGAVDYSDATAYFSSHGPVTWTATEFGDYAYQPGIGLIRPDVCAPGVDIVSLDYTTTDGFTKMSGTSMATPCVAGVMALMLDKNPELTPADISRILETTAHKISPNKNNYTGSGRIDALAAINAIECGNMKYISHAIIDKENGNNNGNLNANEQTDLHVTIKNDSDESYDNVKAVLRTNNRLVKINDSIAQINSISANETFSITEGFNFSVEATADHKTILGLDVYFYNENEDIISVTRIPIKVQDKALNFATVVVKNDDNGNGILEYSETADFGIVINNIGNEIYNSSKCTLTSTNDNITINTNEITTNPIGPQASEVIFFNITASSNISDSFSIPFEVTLENAYGTETLSFTYSNKCEVVFELKDRYGDGWDGATLVVKYSDGSDDDAFTVTEEDGSGSTHTKEIGNGVEVTLEWIKGAWDSECSFVIKKSDGSVIYESTESLSTGIIYSWINDCAFQNHNYEMCEGIQNLEIESPYPVKIKWDSPTSETPLLYEIYRDTRFLGTTEELSFTDETAIGTFNYEYSVRPIYNECKGYSSYINIDHISGERITEKTSIDASVYPNPSKNDFTVVCDNMTRISVYNIMGAMIMNTDVNADNHVISGLNAGVYFINIETNNGSAVRKVVKM
ncbi:MAG: S8 family peptidase [Bacteroidales bacterium]|nr:S8 family peptidase [Bacteroidales bacterium]